MSIDDDLLSAIYNNDKQALDRFSPEQMNTTDSDGRTPLMHAVLGEKADPDLIGGLIRRGADVNAKEDQQWTALHFAARDQKNEIVKILLEAGAEIDPVDNFGDTPLWRAVMNASSDLGVIAELKKRGADPNRKNARSVSPMDIAQQSGRSDIVAVLEKNRIT